MLRKLGADIAINYREQDFEAIVRDAGGADVILDMVGGDYVQKNISAAKIGGRIVNIAYMQGTAGAAQSDAADAETSGPDRHHAAGPAE